MTFLSDTALIFRRHFRLLMREPAYIAFALMQPLLFLILFGPLLTRLPAATFGGSTTGDAWRFFVPGLLAQLALFGSTFVGFAIISDWRAGVIERFRVTPVSRIAIMSGRVLRDVVTLVIQGLLLVLVGLAFGLRAPVGAVLISLGFIAVVAVGLASASYAVALLLKSEDAFAPLVNTVVVPIVLLSGIMLPMTLGPGWLQGVARISPFRYIIDAMRSAFAGDYWNTIMLEGILVALGMAAVCLYLGSRVFLRDNVLSPGDRHPSPLRILLLSAFCGPVLFAHMFGFSGVITPENPNICGPLLVPPGVECRISGHTSMTGLASPRSPGSGRPTGGRWTDRAR